MSSRDLDARGRNNVTNLDEVRQARAEAKNAEKVHDIADEELVAESDDRHGNRRFDAEKVARLKAEIDSGEYKIDPASIAQKFIEHDRNQ